jgi:hypothetical protein
MDVIPRFNEQGVLPPGDYAVTFEALRSSILIQHNTPNWDRSWREHLVENCEILVRQLWKIGIDSIFLDGSFVEEKDHPNDIDGYFDCPFEYAVNDTLERELNALDPYQSWTWDLESRRPVSGSQKRQLPIWHQYRVELYPHYGQPSGILDEFGNPLIFPAAFRRQRVTNEPKGIIRLVKGVEEI